MRMEEGIDMGFIFLDHALTESENNIAMLFSWERGI